jgi:ATP-dependent Clp protease ATP-binding subunit ClpX
LLDEFPGQQITTFTTDGQDHHVGTSPAPPPAPGSRLHLDLDSGSTTSLEKSNILLLGPSGSGKTLLARTLARILDVPFSMSDCTPLTQAGYIGEDAEIVVQRLLAAANYDVARAETGIICLDEIDKIAAARVAHGKDVGGEGVQQSLLKIVEGTSVTVQAKGERTSPSTSRERERHSGLHPDSFGERGGRGNIGGMITGHGGGSGGSGGGGGGGGGGQGGQGKNDVYTVRTDNILFICTGAFIGLHKLVLERIAKGSIGFGAPVRAAAAGAREGTHDTTITIDDSNRDLYREHLPFWHTSSSSPTTSTPYSHSSAAPSLSSPPPAPPTTLNTLDLITPADLQKFGLIPELIGRIPIHCSLSPLTEADLVSVLTRPRNALLKQYAALFALSNVELRFASSAVHAVARRAVDLGTGARGLRSILERALAEPMFETPGSGVRHVLITAAVVDGRQPAMMLGRGQGQLFAALVEEEEERWRAERGDKIDEDEDEARAAANSADGINFQEYRKKVSVAGYS